MLSANTFFNVSSSKPKILIVDDQVENIQLLHMLLEDDYTIFMATDGEQGLQQCRKHMPDIILLDIAMPGLDGYQVCSILKSESLTAHIPIIFITGHIDDSEEAKGFELGAVDYIRKPITPIIVEKRIATHLILRRQEEYLFHLSKFDELTGIANRRHFFNVLQKLWHSCIHKKEPLSIVMLGIDNFKDFNYLYGHLAGDAALKMISKIVQQCVQLPDSLVARYNGEEFCCLLPFVCLNDAVIIAEELRSHVEKLSIETNSSDKNCLNESDLNKSDLKKNHIADMDHLTVSAGVASTISNLQITTPELLLFEANKYLNLAKKSGKNCIKYNDH